MSLKSPFAFLWVSLLTVSISPSFCHLFLELLGATLSACLEHRWVPLSYLPRLVSWLFQPLPSYTAFYQVFAPNCLTRGCNQRCISRSFWCRSCEHFISITKLIFMTLAFLLMFCLFLFPYLPSLEPKRNRELILSLELKSMINHVKPQRFVGLGFPVCLWFLSLFFLWSDFRLFIFSFICCRVLVAMFLLANSGLKSFSRLSHLPELALVFLPVSFPRE